MHTAYQVAQAHNLVDKYGVPLREAIEAIVEYASSACVEQKRLCGKEVDKYFDLEGLTHTVYSAPTPDLK